MGIRETLNKNPAITTAGTAGIIVVALVFIIYQLSGSGRPKPQTQAYFTTDDGKTWFADDVNKIPPFDHNGAQAVLANIYSCDGGSTKFIAYLQKYNDDAKKKLIAISAKAPAGDVSQGALALEEIRMNGVLVKKPGGATWVRMREPAAGEITNIACPNGGKLEDLEPVVP